MDIEQLTALIDTVAKSGLTEFSYSEGNLKIDMKQEKEIVNIQPAGVLMAENSYASGVSGNVSLMGEAPAVQNYGAANVQAEVTTVKPEEPQGNVVCAPLVGTFYTAPAEGADTYVKVGDSVKKGQIVAIVEAMKLMNEIECEYSGTITEVLVENGQSVEYGQPLFRVS